MRSGSQLRRNTSHPTVKVQTPRAIRLSKPVEVNPEHVRTALADARAQDVDSFRRREAAWLREHVAPLGTAIEVTFAHVMSKEGPVAAEATMMGSYLGGSVLRLAAAEQGTDGMVNNIRTWEVVEQGMLYAGQEIPEDVLHKVFGKDTGQELLEIRNPVSQAACAVAIGVSLSPAR